MSTIGLFWLVGAVLIAFIILVGLAQLALRLRERRQAKELEALGKALQDEE